MEGVRLATDERVRSRVLLLDADNRLIAYSKDKGILSERYPLRTEGGRSAPTSMPADASSPSTRPQVTRPIAALAGAE